MIETIILLFFSLFLIGFIFWRFLRNPDWPAWPTQPPTWKGIKETLKYKPKKRFYEEGYADEIDDPDEEEQNSKSLRR